MAAVIVYAITGLVTADVWRWLPTCDAVDARQHEAEDWLERDDVAQPGWRPYYRRNAGRACPGERELTRVNEAPGSTAEHRTSRPNDGPRIAEVY
jgi:hypothetical protein